MCLYQIIRDQLVNSGTNLSLEQIKRLDIIEYMVLEATGKLPSLQGTNLKCIFRPGFTGNLVNDDKPKSGIELGTTDQNVDKATQAKFKSIAQAITVRFCQGFRDFEHRFYNYAGTLFSFIIPDEEIEQAIRSSSLFIAAGELYSFNLNQLAMLRKKLSYYKITDTDLSILVHTLTLKVMLHMQNNFQPNDIYQAIIGVDQIFAEEMALQEALLNQKLNFNQLFFTFREKASTQKGKKSVTYEGGCAYGNEDYNQEYNDAADDLVKALEHARNFYFNSTLSPHDFETFKVCCTKAFEVAQDKFFTLMNSNEWHDELYPIFQKLMHYCETMVKIKAGESITNNFDIALDDVDLDILPSDDNRPASSDQLQRLKKAIRPSIWLVHVLPLELVL